VPELQVNVEGGLETAKSEYKGVKSERIRQVFDEARELSLVLNKGGGLG
jgi:hypothetical protein